MFIFEIYLLLNMHEICTNEVDKYVDRTKIVRCVANIKSPK